MGIWVVRVLVAAGLLANAVAVPHPVGLAIAQAGLAIVVLGGWGATTTLAIGALMLVPLPFAEVRRWLSHTPLGCACQLSTGQPGLWAAAGAAANVGLIGLCGWVARRSALAKPTGAATES